MKRNLLIIFALILLSHLLLYNADWGLNLLILDVLLVAAILKVKPEIIGNSGLPFLLLLLGLLLSGVFVLLHNSILAKIVHTLFFIITIGFCHAWQPRLWFFGLIQTLWAVPTTWLYLIVFQRKSSSFGQPRSFSFRTVGMIAIPILIVIPFYLLYQQGSSQFGNLNNWLASYFEKFIQLNFDFSRIFHLFFIALPLLAILRYAPTFSFLNSFKMDWAFGLLRKRERSLGSSIMGLKWEYRTGILTFLTLNAILLLVNALDWWYVWLSPKEKTAHELSKFVHEGTWVLIFSILLAMAVVLFFFRKNQHFYPKSKLRSLAKLWIAQNTFLALSVGVRNGHYISKHGLAEGRIVVLFFLILVLYGLWTMARKVSQNKSIFYLIHHNSWAFLVVLLIASSVNWSAAITRYNLAFMPEAQSDYYYLSRLPEQNLFLLLEEKYENGNTSIPDFGINRKVKAVRYRHENSDWRSWTYSQYRNYQAIKKYGLEFPDNN